MEGFEWLNEPAYDFLKRDYLLEGQTVSERVKIIADRAEEILEMPGFADKFIENMKKGWYSLSSPIWSNFGTSRGLPVSCFGSHISDRMESILGTAAEIGMMSKYGGGTSAYFGEVRPRGAPITDNGNSSGSVHFMQYYDSLISVSNQGAVRRGNLAVYLPIDHEDIEEFLTIRGEDSEIQNLLFGVTVRDEWIRSMVDGDPDKRRIWAKVLQARANVGLPYIFFHDNVQKGKPDCYADLEINHSNLCCEIALPDDDDESFVCVLSSMNVYHYDEWKDTDAVEILTYFLDAVVSEFIEKSENLPFMERAWLFAKNHRALGIGQLGWHSYLQSKMIPFESLEANMLTSQIAKNIKTKAYDASQKLSGLFGPPQGFPDLDRRNTTLIAIAPTKSSSFILGQVSEGIEPRRTNYSIKDLAKGKFSMRNPELVKLLEEKGQNTEEVWLSILKSGGTVAHLDFLTDQEKMVFKTFQEISPLAVVTQASIRQKHIDQAQSLNLMIHPSIPVKDVNSLILEAWRLGVKTLYYQHSVNAAQEFARDILDCTACES